MEPILRAVDDVVRETYIQGRFGDLGPAFAAALGSWIEPLAAAMREVDPTPHSRAAARATADLARLTAEYAGHAMQSIAGPQAGDAGAGPGPGHDELAGRIDDAFRAFSSSPEFNRARRAAAAAVLDWLERDPAATASLARALEPPPSFIGPEPFGVPPPPEPEPVLRDGNVTLTASPGAGEARASVLVVPGFTAGPRMLDLDPQRSAVRTLAAHGVDVWLLDWGRTDETDRYRTVANQLERIDRAVDAVREAKGRRPALAGHFHGGLLALLYCLRHPSKAAALVALSTPVRFSSGDDAFAGWLRACDGERLVDVLGNVPGPLLAALAGASSPMRWCGGGFLTLLGDLDSAAAAARIARFEQARRFPPAFPGETFRGLYRAFYRDDSFAEGGAAVIDGHRYKLSGLDPPLLNVFARDDRIVPPAASLPLAEWTRTAPGSNLEQPGGHYDLLTGHRAYTDLLPGIAGWLVERARGS